MSGELCVLILQHNSTDLTLNLLESIVQHERENLGGYRFILMDNASDDPGEEEIKRRFPFVEFVRFDENLGFARAHNRIWPSVKEKWALLLNNDCLLLNDAISRTLGKARKLSADFATCAVFNEDMSPQMNFHLSELPVSLWEYLRHVTGLQSLLLNRMKLRKETARLDYASGTFLLIRRDVLTKAGTFDESHFMYGEDVDLMFRLKKMGAKGYRFASGRIVHLNQASSKRKWDDETIYQTRKRERERIFLRYMPAWRVRLWQLLNDLRRAALKVLRKGPPGRR